MSSAMRFDPTLLDRLLKVETSAELDSILGMLPIVDPEEYHVDYNGPRGSWREGRLHWIPVGNDRGNGGRIKLAGQPTNPIAERLNNGMEAIIELMRFLEVKADPSAPMPRSPREAVLRYFGLPRLDSIPRLSNLEEHRKMLGRINEARVRLNVRLTYSKASREFTVVIRDLGMGQMPDRIHETLLSLGQSDKADKPYMIGVFGQGGSSAFAASKKASVVISRRAPDLLSEGDDAGVGWSIVQQIFSKGRRDNYFAYLACTPEGHVPRFDAKVADAVGFKYGTRFSHIDYDFGGSGAAVARLLYQALNHVLFNPILPYDLFTLDKERPELMQGTAQRLARQAVNRGREAIDKSFESQPVVLSA